MDSVPGTAEQNRGGMMNDLRWSHAEKVVAREAFRRALQREFEEVIRKTREKRYPLVQRIVPRPRS
jgi:hypothetical protein